ncbi:MAG: hypothetical protein IMF19_04380 [Proteobacteria bacterium]|nr:hypothetical protein [Pseudomonadota bacterium]
MTVAKIAPYNFGKLKKKVKKVAGRFFAPPSGVPGQTDYPAITKAIEAQKKHRKLLDEMGR